MLVNPSAWTGRRVLVTGHTGFKGGWLALWLRERGAAVTGFALPPPTKPSFFEQVGLRNLVDHVEGDVRDLPAVDRIVRDRKPEIIFHLAAQSLVRPSYEDPVETYATNVMGTVNVLDACRRVEGVRAIVCATSDKCYENQERIAPYRESDPMGGHDPYSSSKGAAELAIASFRRSYFADGPLVASVRAGNVIGGGDWSTDRLVPDLARAMLAGATPIIRSPDSVRPWQHVLDALSGYLAVSERLLDGSRAAACGWNFGPSSNDTRTVSFVAAELLGHWGIERWETPNVSQPHEAKLLTLDSTKAMTELNWRPRLALKEAIGLTAEWHRRVADGGDALETSLEQLRGYEEARTAQAMERTS